MHKFKLVLFTSLALLVPASVSMAATASDDTVVSAEIGQELSITATPSITLKQDPIAGTGDLTPTKPVGGTGEIDIISTESLVDVIITDSTPNATGHLHKPSVGQLQQPLTYDATTNVAASAADITSGVNFSTALTGGQEYLVSGSSNFDHIINFRQALNADEDVLAGDTYSVIVTYYAVGYTW